MYFQTVSEHTDAFYRWQNTEMTSNIDPMTSRVLRSFTGELYANRILTKLSGIWWLLYQQKCATDFDRSGKENLIIDMSAEARSPVRFALNGHSLAAWIKLLGVHMYHLISAMVLFGRSDWSIVLSVTEFASLLDDKALEDRSSQGRVIKSSHILPFECVCLK